MDVGTEVKQSRAAHLGPERRRPQILDAALTIAAEQGVSAVTVSAVADRLKVTRPVVYSCFADRVQLIDALLRREEGYLISHGIEALSHGRVDAGEEMFVPGFHALLSMVAERPDSWRFVLDADPDPAVAALFRRGRAVLAEHFSTLIRPTLRHWGTQDLDRKLPVLVEHFASATEGAVRSLLHEGSTWSPAELGELIGRAVYRALRHA